MTEPELVAGEAPYLERFALERPTEPYTMRVLRDEWTELDGVLLRTIFEFELIS